MRAEYRITRRGRVLLSIWEWERRWVPDQVDRLPGMRHTFCDSDFAPTLTCRSCGEAGTEKEVTARSGPSGSWRRSVPETASRRRSAGIRGQAGLFPVTMIFFGNRWAAALLGCAFLGDSRFTDFQDRLGAPSLLAGRLQTFCAIGVLRTSRQSDQSTEKGRAFFPVVIAALQTTVRPAMVWGARRPGDAPDHLGPRGTQVSVGWRLPRSDDTTAQTEHNVAADAAVPPTYRP